MYSETSFRLIKGDFSLLSDYQKILRRLYCDKLVYKLIVLMMVTSVHGVRLEAGRGLTGEIVTGGCGCSEAIRH